jgi:cytosine/adenosine deaminase-related metal-dependent hydrolase
MVVVSVKVSAEHRRLAICDGCTGHALPTSLLNTTKHSSLHLLSELRMADLTITNVALPGTEAGTQWTVTVKNGVIDDISRANESIPSQGESINGKGALLAPSLCHPHIHLDKAFLLPHPKYADLQIEKGDFQEAMDLTGKAKSMFEQDDLLERGQRLIDESVAAGVTHMRAFVEVDAGVGDKCLNAGITLRQKAKVGGSCEVQLCAFAQLPLFSSSPDDEDGSVIRDLMRQAARNGDVHAIGSTPYVEQDRQKMMRNVEWMVDLSMEFNLHLDFHLDYNLDPEIEPLVWHVINTLQYKSWRAQTSEKTVVLGHCTRLTLFDDDEWFRLADAIGEAELPISFVGLPTSDLFMMRTGQRPEVRGTLDVPRLINKYFINASIGFNNIGNAFTPQGSCDPLMLACQGVGVYQAGTKADTELLYECVSTRARTAIGLGRAVAHDTRLEIRKGDQADLLLFEGTEKNSISWKTRSSISEAVYLYDHCNGRRALLGGKMINASGE